MAYSGFVFRCLELSQTEVSITFIIKFLGFTDFVYESFMSCFMTPYSSDCNENHIYTIITFTAEKKRGLNF